MKLLSILIKMQAQKKWLQTILLKLGEKLQVSKDNISTRLVLYWLVNSSRVMINNRKWTLII
jgi:hypothetical protein